MPNLRAGFSTRARLPVSPAIFTSELLDERLVPVLFDESTVVERTDYPTTVSSPDADARGILAAGLERAKTQIKNCKSTTKSTRLQNTQPVTYR